MDRTNSKIVEKDKKYNIQENKEQFRVRVGGLVGQWLLFLARKMAYDAEMV